MNPSPDQNRPSARWRALLPWLWVLLPGMVGAALCRIFFEMAVDHDLWITWSHWLWFPQWPFYGDLAITLQNFTEAKGGVDLLSDPASEFAYPRVVLAFRHLHLQDLPSAGACVGTFQAAVWMATLIFVLRPRSFFRALLTAAIFFTPPILMGLERSNIDLALFVMCVAAAVLWARADRVRQLWWPAGVTLLAALLKLYPVFALIGGAWTETGRRRLVWVLALLGGGIYWVTHPGEISLIMSKFHLGFNTSWGCVMLFEKIPALQPRGELSDLPQVWLISVAVYAVAFLGAAVTGHRLAPGFKGSPIDRREWAYYWFGSAICCGSFLASNYAYRWVFALLTLPLLLRMAGMRQFRPAWWARAALIALTISLSTRLDAKHALFFTAQVANWAYLLLLVVGFVALRPQYLVSDSTSGQVSRPE